MTIKLEWIRELIDLIPKTKTSRKNIIEIAGYPKWENVNSNLLAFYFDQNEEHKFGNLFINSLLDLISEKADDSVFSRENFETDFIVEREFQTLKGGRIDVLILGNELQEEVEDETVNNNNEAWAIILENKLTAPLYNNLSDYWKSVDVDDNRKIGVILSIGKVINLKNHKKPFVNITHRELVDKIKVNLHEYYDEADDRHLLFLKEYFANIYSFYKDDKYTKNMDTTLKLFHSKKEDINKFKQVDLKLLKYVSKTVFNVMTEMGFPPNSNKDTSHGKHFQISIETDNLNVFLKDNIEYAKKFRFWVHLSRLRYSNEFVGYFELWGKSNTKYGDELKQELENLNIFNESVRKGSRGRANSGYQHIYDIKIMVDTSTDEEFGLVLQRALKDKLFNHENKFIETAITKLKEIIERQ